MTTGTIDTPYGASREARPEAAPFPKPDKDRRSRIGLAICVALLAMWGIAIAAALHGSIQQSGDDAVFEITGP